MSWTALISRGHNIRHKDVSTSADIMIIALTAGLGLSAGQVWRVWA